MEEDWTKKLVGQKNYEMEVLKRVGEKRSMVESTIVEEDIGYGTC